MIRHNPSLYAYTLESNNDCEIFWKSDFHYFVTKTDYKCNTFESAVIILNYYDFHGNGESVSSQQK